MTRERELRDGVGCGEGYRGAAGPDASVGEREGQRALEQASLSDRRLTLLLCRLGCTVDESSLCEEKSQLRLVLRREAKPKQSQTHQETENNRRDAAEACWVPEEEDTRGGNGELVQSADHTEGGRTCRADDPSGGEADANGCSSREGHEREKGGTVLGGAVKRNWSARRAVIGARSRSSQVANEALVAPILEDQGEDDEGRDTEKVVVAKGFPIAEAGDLDALAHGEDEGGRDEAVRLGRKGQNERIKTR